MLRKPKILLINDDGIHAPGLKHLWKGLAEVGDLLIVAPNTERSGVGQGISMHHPLHLERVDWEGDTPAWSLSGTPADCVKIALSVLLDEPPDLILSGINSGSNAGRNTFYSGTIGGVIEGALHNIQGAAISCYDCINPLYEVAEQHLPPLVQFLLNHPLPLGTFLNVNFPPRALEKFKGCRLARQGKSYWKEAPYLDASERASHYWIGGVHAQFEEDAESDIALLEQGYMTAVPISIRELTDQAVLKAKAASFASFFDSPLGFLNDLEERRDGPEFAFIDRA